MSAGSSPGPKRGAPVHALRILMLVGILMMLRLHHGKAVVSQEAEIASIEPAAVQVFFPTAASLDSTANASGGYSVLDDGGHQLGVVMQTSPAADHIVGFSGPTNVLLIFDNDETLLYAEIISSRDTPNHVQAVLDDPGFLENMHGRTKAELSNPARVDGVSGATLTSVAIRESIAYRLGEIRSSLRFPRDPTLEEVRVVLPDAAAARKVDGHFEALDGQDAVLGTLYRTSPTADSIMGYQGPTDTLIGLDGEGRVAGIVPLQTYDNEEYVYYVRVDDYFREIFNGKTLGELAQTDLVEAKVEGVSGATYTSMAMARGIVARAEALQESGSVDEGTQRHLRISLTDVASILIIVFGIAMGLTKLRSNARLRVAYSLVLVAYLGLYSGEMISLAMFAGWARHGIPWIPALVLVLLSIAAVLLPVATGHNIYCHHLCPHGAVQQVIRRISKKRVRIAPGVMRVLKPLRGILLTVCVVLAFVLPGFSLVQLEPFDAWVWSVAGWATITIAIVGLCASFVIPMAYCRFGCPTGYLLDMLRRHRRSDRWGTADWTALGLLSFAIALHFAF